MKISELLQKILDLSSQDSDAVNTLNNPEEVETGVFMPPLQAGIELMKKSAGEPHDLDMTQSSDTDSESCGCDSYEDEWTEMSSDDSDADADLMIIRKNAGLVDPLFGQENQPGM